MNPTLKFPNVQEILSVFALAASSATAKILADIAAGVPANLAVARQDLDDAMAGLQAAAQAFPEWPVIQKAYDDMAFFLRTPTRATGIVSDALAKIRDRFMGLDAQTLEQAEAMTAEYLSSRGFHAGSFSWAMLIQLIAKLLMLLI